MFEARLAAPGFAARMLDPDPEMQTTRRYTLGTSHAPFVPWGQRLLPVPEAEVAMAGSEEIPLPPMPFEAVIDANAREAEAHAEGVAKGYARAVAELAGERAAVAALIDSLAALVPEPPQALALLLAETVGRLVRQIVGEVAVDPALMAARTEAVAALIIDGTSPRRLRMHPDDAARLAEMPPLVEIAPDPTLAPGAVQADCGDGWIEDGPDGALERLHAVLDRLGAPR